MNLHTWHNWIISWVVHSLTLLTSHTSSLCISLNGQSVLPNMPQTLNLQTLSCLCLECSSPLPQIPTFPLLWLFLCVLVTQLCPTLQPHDLSVKFSRQECWGGLPFPSPRYHPNLGIEPCTAGRFFTIWAIISDSSINIFFSKYCFSRSNTCIPML